MWLHECYYMEPFNKQFILLLEKSVWRISLLSVCIINVQYMYSLCEMIFLAHISFN